MDGAYFPFRTEARDALAATTDSGRKIGNPITTSSTFVVVDELLEARLGGLAERAGVIEEPMRVTSSLGLPRTRLPAPVTRAEALAAMA